jgi:uncharacterized protein YndB with AHSA1/START domain
MPIRLSCPGAKYCQDARRTQASQLLCGFLLSPFTVGRGLVASARATINAPIAEVWDALVNPEVIRQYMFGATVVSEWKKGSPIVWKGVWQGRPYEDKGRILEFKPERIISYTHYSPLSGLPDVPANYHTVTVELLPKGKTTLVTLSQDNNPTAEAHEHSKKNWETMLAGLKKMLEVRLHS